MNKYIELYNQMRQEILSSVFKPGMKLPSIRVCAKNYGFSNSTVINAYEKLEKENLIYSASKSGYYVLDTNKLNNFHSNNNSIDFTHAYPSNEILPFKDFQACLNQAVDVYKEELFTYSKSQGLKGLRQVLEKYLQNYQIFSSSGNIFITTGSQQALFLLTLMPFPNGKKNILLEQPTYAGMLKSIELAGKTALGIERTEKGIDFERLENIFRNDDIKFFYIVPRFHNPTGYSFSNEEKKKIVYLAQKYDVYIVEDDYLADLELNSRIDSIYSFDQTSHTIYIKSFSKTMLPGLRIGIAIIPDLIGNAFERYKYFNDLNTSVLSQGALEIYIKSGMLNNHIKKVREFYKKRMGVLKMACEKTLPEKVKYSIPNTGFSTVMELPENIQAENLAERLKRKNVYIMPAQKMYLPSFYRENIFKITICNISEQQIEDGINMIGEEIEYMMKNQVCKTELILGGRFL